MDFETALKLIVNYGLGLVLAVAIAYMFWRLLIFVLRENSKREDRLAAIIEQHLKALEGGNTQMQTLLMAHDQRCNDATKQIMEAFSRLREENEEQIEVLKEMKIDLQELSKKS